MNMAAVPEIVKGQKPMMFTIGVDPHEISQCIKENRTKFIQAGAKVGNLPGKLEQNIAFLSGLRDKAQRTACQWFIENCNFDGLPDPLSALDVLQSQKTSGLDKDEQRRLWRAIFSAYVQPDCPATIEEFLKGRVRVVAHPNNPIGGSSESLAITSKDLENSLMALDKAGEGIALGLFMPALLMGVIAASRGDLKGLGTSRRALEQHPSTLARKFVPFLDALIAQQKASNPSRVETGPKAPLQLADVQLGSPEDYPILVRLTKQLPSGQQAFMHVVGIVLEDQLVVLSEDEARSIFPGHGDITVFKQLAQIAGQQEELSVWRVSHDSPGRGTEYVGKSFVSRVHDIIKVPHSSGEPEKVRYWIQHSYVHHANVRPLFQLADGPIIKFQGEVADPANAHFDQAFCAYNSLSSVLWHGRNLVIGALPTPNFWYDCAPTATLVKRLLRERAEINGLPIITKAQLHELADFAGRDGSERMEPVSIGRAVRCLEEVASTKELLNDVVQEVLKLPQVADAIALEKERITNEFKANMQSEEAAVAKLKSMKEALESDLQKIRRSQKEQVETLSNEIKKVFERAREDGIKTLANVALLSSVLPNYRMETAVQKDASPVDAPENPKLDNVAQAKKEEIRNGKPISSAKEFHVALSKHVLASGLSGTMLRNIIAAAVSGGMVGLLGTKQREALLTLSGLLTGGTYSTVSVSGDMFSISDLLNAPAAIYGSVAESSSLGEFLLGEQEAGRLALVELRGINRAPPESFSPELLSVAGRNGSPDGIAWTDKAGKIRHLRFNVPVVFLLGFAVGKSVFPLMPPVAWEVPIIDTDADWGDWDEPMEGAVGPLGYTILEFWSSLATGGTGLSDAPFGKLPQAAKYRAVRMAKAAVNLNFQEGEALSSALLAYTIGRLGTSELTLDISNIEGHLAPLVHSIGKVDQRLLKQIIDMGCGE
jgi:hypothetical protein